MTTLIENAVTLADLAKVAKRSVVDLKAECAALGAYVGVDWANREAINVADAHGIVSGKLRETHELEQAWQRYVRDAEEWTRRRDEAVQVASSIASRNATLAFEGPGKSQQDGADAGREAGRAYELANPAPTWLDGTMPWVGAQPKYSGETGVLRRILDRVSGGVA